MFFAGAGVFFPEPEFFLPEPEPEVKNPEFAQHYWKCGKKSPKRPKVSSKYCDYFNKVSVFKYLNICLWLSEYLSLNIRLSLFTKTLEVFWSIFDSFRLVFIYTH